MTTIDVIERVKSRLDPINPIDVNRLDFLIELQIPTARIEVARKVASGAYGQGAGAFGVGQDYKDILRKDFSLTVASGTCDLTSHTLSTEPLLYDFIAQGVLMSTESSYPWQWLPDRGALILPRPRFYVYYCLDGLTLRTVDLTGSLTGLTTTCTARVNYIPTLSSLPYQLEELMIEEVFNRVKGWKQTELPPLPGLNREISANA